MQEHFTTNVSVRDVEPFVASVKTDYGAEEATVVEKIIQWAREHGLKISITDYGSLIGELAWEGRNGRRFTISKGRLYFVLDHLRSIVPFDQDPQRSELFSRIEKVHPSIRITEKAANGSGSPSIGLSELANGNALEKWLGALGWFIEEMTTVLHMDDKNTEHNNASRDSPYLPTREDFENARRKLLREGKKRVPVAEILDIMQTIDSCISNVLFKAQRKTTCPDERAQERLFLLYRSHGTAGSGGKLGNIHGRHVG